MPTNEIRELRHRYKTAYTAYLSCVQALSDASDRGELSPETIQKEGVGFTELALVRNALLETLRRYRKPADAAS